jgi:hypothetical protein
MKAECERFNSAGTSLRGVTTVTFTSGLQTSVCEYFVLCVSDLLEKIFCANVCTVC